MSEREDVLRIADAATREIHGDDYRVATRLIIERAIAEAIQRPSTYLTYRDGQRVTVEGVDNILVNVKQLGSELERLTGERDEARQLNSDTHETLTKERFELIGLRDAARREALEEAKAACFSDSTKMDGSEWQAACFTCAAAIDILIHSLPVQQGAGARVEPTCLHCGAVALYPHHCPQKEFTMAVGELVNIVRIIKMQWEPSSTLEGLLIKVGDFLNARSLAPLPSVRAGARVVEWPEEPSAEMIEAGCAALKEAEHLPGYWENSKDGAWKAAWRHRVTMAYRAMHGVRLKSPAPLPSGESNKPISQGNEK